LSKKQIKIDERRQKKSKGKCKEYSVRTKKRRGKNIIGKKVRDQGRGGVNDIV